MAVMFFFSVDCNFDYDEFMRTLLLRGDFKFRYTVQKSTFDYILRVLNIEKLNQYLVDALDDEFRKEEGHVGYIAYNGYVKITRLMMDDYGRSRDLGLHDSERRLVRRICVEEENNINNINMMAAMNLRYQQG